MAAAYPMAAHDIQQAACPLCAASLCVDGNTVDTLRQALKLERGSFAGGLDDYLRHDGDPLILQNLERAELPVWVVGLDRDREAATQACEAILRSSHGHGSIIAVSGQAEPECILQAMRAGCSEYLVTPVTVDNFGDALRRLRVRLDGKQGARRSSSGRVVVLLGARGGAGVTTLAVHLGCYLQRQYGKKTLLLDEHRRLGHVSLYLGQEAASYHFYELARNVDRLDESLLQGFVMQRPGCPDVLPSPENFEDGDGVTLDEIQRSIRWLGEHYEFVVIDCPRGVHNLSLATIDCCDEVYLVATPDVPALRDLSRCLDSFAENNVPREKIKVVINRYSSSGALSRQQIEKAIQRPIAFAIPNASSELIAAMNTGSPVLPDRKSEFVAQMKRWAATLVPDAGPEEMEPKRRFAFWS